MKGFKSTSTDPYTYTQSGVWKKGQYTFQAVVLSNSGYAFAFQRADTTWQTVDLSWQVRGGSYSKIQWTFTLEVDAVAFRLIANRVKGETTVLQPMLEKGTNGSTPIAHEEDLRGMDGDFHEFIFTRNNTGIAPDAPLSTQEDDLEPEDWTDNPKGVTKEIPFEFVSMREKHSGVWLDFSPPSLWAKWSEDGLSVNIRVQGHYQSHWEGVNKITEIVGGEIINDTEVIKCTAIFREGEEDIASDVASSRGFIWEVNGVEIARDVPYITLDESYGDGLADYVTLSFLIGNKRESDQAEILNISEGMDGIGEEFIFKANNDGEVPPVLPQTTDVDYQNDDYHGDWSDDPVAPTESNQFVWVAKRKKVGGIWEAFGDPSVWTWWVTDGGDAAYWELHSSAPLIYKDAEDASTSGVHTTITLSGRYVEGATSQNGGYISAQPIGGVEDTPLPTPREFTPPNNAGVDEYVFRLYDGVSKTTHLDTLTVPIAFKGEKGVSAINITLSNEKDTLPATADGVVTDYTGSGTTIRVFEGSQELSYGTGNGQYQVSASGSNISPSPTPTTNGKVRVYGNASNMGTAATAVITFTVSGKTFGGESFSFDKVQNFTKAERGDDGDGILEVIDYYGVSLDSNVLPTTWYTTVPTKGANEYLWNYERILYTDGTYDETEPRVIQGKDAKSISTIVNQYVYSSSDTVQPQSEWKPTISELGAKPEGYFLWVRDFITYTDGTTSTTDGYVVKDGGDGEDGITIIPNQQSHTYRADLNGNIIGSLADGMVELTITSGSTPITCTSAASGGTPTTNGTYRVTRTLGNGITTNQSLSGGKYRITPATLTVDGTSVELEIKIMMGGVVTSYPLTLTYLKQFDGADGKSTEFIFKGSTSDTTAPTLPSTSQQDDWYGQGTSNLWNDDLIEPTKTLPYVWASQRKKVDGVWGAFMPPKVWLRWTEDGDGITSTTIEYAKSSIGTTPPSDGWSTSISTPTQGWYLWTRTTTTYKVAATTVSYSVSHWAKDGDGIVSTTIEYAKSSSGTTIPESDWSTSIPSPTKGWYLWTRTTTVYKTSPTTVAYTTSYWAEDGDGIVSTTMHYAKSSSGTTIPSDWSTTTPTPTKGMYLWTRTTTVYKKSPTTVAYTTSYWAKDGDDAKSITLSANATKITVGQGNVSSPTEISVKATAVNTTVETWEYSTDGGAFTATKPSFVTVVSTTERTISSSTLFKTITLRASRVADEASGIITISREGGAPYVDSTTRTWWAWNEELGVYTDTGMSPVGIDGAIPYPAGYYESTKRYRREAEYAPYVQYGGTLYLLIKDTPNAGILPTNTTYWKAFNQWEAVFISSLVAQFAKIGGAVFTGDTSNVSSNIRGRMISQKGVNNTNNYNTYTGDSGSWQPKLMLDFETGKAKFSAGYIGGLTIEDGKLLIGDVGDNRIELDPSSRKMIFTTYDNFNAGHIGFDAEGALLDLYKRFSASTNYSSSVRVDGYGFLVSRYGQSGNVTGSVLINPTGVKVSDASNTTEVRDDGVYLNGVKQGGGGGYTHPSSHPISFITGLQSALDGKVGNSRVLTDVPANAKFTDTIYTHPSHTARTSGLYKITVNSLGHVTGATAVAKSDITALGIPAQDTTYGVATTSVNGLMSSTDKSKLNGIATGANKYSHPTGAGNNHIPSGGAAGQFLKWSSSGVAVWANVSGALSGITTLTASTSVTAPKVIFSAAGWSLEQSGNELVMKHNGVVRQRYLNDGTILATGGVTAFQMT